VNEMGEAKRRKNTDPNYGKGIGGITAERYSEYMAYIENLKRAKYSQGKIDFLFVMKQIIDQFGKVAALKSYVQTEPRMRSFLQTFIDCNITWIWADLCEEFTAAEMQEALMK
jgi:hypothetical protein